MNAERRAFDQLELLGVPTDPYCSPTSAGKGAYTAQLKAVKLQRNTNIRKRALPEVEVMDDRCRKRMRKLEDAVKRICADEGTLLISRFCTFVMKPVA